MVVYFIMGCSGQKKYGGFNGDPNGLHKPIPEGPF
jgi:hypothetical protein